MGVPLISKKEPDADVPITRTPAVTGETEEVQHNKQPPDVKPPPGAERHTYVLAIAMRPRRTAAFTPTEPQGTVPNQARRRWRWHI
jgi:hypothetical protein